MTHSRNKRWITCLVIVALVGMASPAFGVAAFSVKAKQANVKAALLQWVKGQAGGSVISALKCTVPKSIVRGDQFSCPARSASNASEGQLKIKVTGDKGNLVTMKVAWVHSSPSSTATSTDTTVITAGNAPTTTTLAGAPAATACQGIATTISESNEADPSGDGKNAVVVTGTVSNNSAYTINTVTAEWQVKYANGAKSADIQSAVDQVNGVSHGFPAPIAPGGTSTWTVTVVDTRAQGASVSMIDVYFNQITSTFNYGCQNSRVIEESPQ